MYSEHYTIVRVQSTSVRVGRAHHEVSERQVADEQVGDRAHRAEAREHQQHEQVAHRAAHEQQGVGRHHRRAHCRQLRRVAVILRRRLHCYINDHFRCVCVTRVLCRRFACSFPRAGGAGGPPLWRYSRPFWCQVGIRLQRR